MTSRPATPPRIIRTSADLRDDPRAVMDAALESEVVIVGPDGKPRIYVRRRLEPLE